SFSSSALSSLICALSLARVSHISLLRSVWLVRDVLDTVRCDLPQVFENLFGEPLDFFVCCDVVPFFQYVTPGPDVAGDDQRRRGVVGQHGPSGFASLLTLVARGCQNLDNLLVGLLCRLVLSLEDVADSAARL